MIASATFQRPVQLHRPKTNLFSLRHRIQFAQAHSVNTRKKPITLKPAPCWEKKGN